MFRLTAALLLAAPLLAQSPVERTLGAPRTWDGSFSEITAVRELSDGRVIVLDGRDQAIRLIDLPRGTSKPIGKAGSGPGEFKRATGLLRGRGDTTWVTDPGNGRLLVVAPDGSTPAVVSLGTDRTMSLWAASASDAAGNIFGAAVLVQPGPDADPTAPPDSQALVRYAVASGIASRVAVVAAPPSRITIKRSGEKIETINVTRPPFAVGDQFAVAPDGRVAIARRDPYRLDVVQLNGSVSRGSPVPVTRIRVGEAERKEHLENLPGTVAAGSIEWPEFLPAFPPRSVIALVNGETWVRRNVPATSASAYYDIFDRAGKRIARLTVSRNRRVLAVGPRGTWVAMTDDDGLQHLELYTNLRDAAR